MKCIDFDNRLNDVLDLRLSPADDAALQAHAESCADCRELLYAQDSLFAGLDQLRHATRAPDFGRSVVAELQPTVALATVSATSQRQLRWFPLLASAAAVLLAVSFGVWIANRNGTIREAAAPAPPQQKTGNGLAIAKPGVPTVKPAELPQVPPQVTPPQEAVVAVPKSPESRSPALPGMDQAMASIASHWPQAGQWSPVEALNVQQVEHYAPGIRPIRESFEVALDALLKTLPGKKETVRPTQPQALQPYGDWLNVA